MDLLIQEAISGANLLYTILLGFILLYWVVVIIGALDLDFLNFDVDADTDVDLDMDVDLDTDIDTEIDTDVEVEGAATNVWSGMSFSHLLAFFNIGKVPFMIFLSILVLSMWTSSILVHYLFGKGIHAFFFIWLVPNLIISLFLTKLFTMPFKGSYAAMNKGGTNKKDLVGKTGELIMQIQPDKMGRMEVYADDEHFTLDVFSHEAYLIERGQRVIIVEYDSLKDRYTVEPFDV